MWWTSCFSHRFKKFLDQQDLETFCANIGICVKFLSSPPYYRNISLKRLLNHYLIAKDFRKSAWKIKPKPDVVIASTPPPTLALQALKYAKAVGSKIIIDTQDMWPEAFYYIVPKILRPAAYIGFLHWHRMVKKTYSAADGYIGSAAAYIDRAIELGGSKNISEVIPLGIDIELFDKAAAEGICPKFKKPKGDVWFVYAGSLTRNHDFITPIHAFAMVHDKLNSPVKFFIVGRGYLSQKIGHLLKKFGLSNIIQTGYLELNKLSYLLSQCDIGINPSWPETRIYLPYKLFYYFAGSLAILNTMPGECSRILRDNNCGIDYRAGDIKSCAEAMMRITCKNKEMSAMKSNSRLLAQNMYDRKMLCKQYALAVERIVSNSCSLKNND
jgi:glycosyltransferase involved in cell wall biosynthesis